MISHYIVSAFRHITKSKGVFAANVFGFTLNFIVVIFGLNYVLFELSYDGYHEKGDRIYRLLVYNPQYGHTSPSVSGRVAPTLVENYPEVESAVRIYYRSRSFRASADDHAASGAYNVAFADPDVFDVFSFGTIHPSTITEFNRPNTAVVSRTVASRFFGTEDPVGKLLYSDELESGPVEVIGVVDDVPRNTHLRPDIFVSFDSLPDMLVGRRSDLGWGMQQFLTYVLLVDDREEILRGFLEKLEAFPDIYVPDMYSPDILPRSPVRGILFAVLGTA